MSENAKKPRGLWIAFEGVDGSGKSTQVKILSEKLGALPVFEPGNTKTGEKIREILLHGENISGITEALLFAADRVEHLEKVVEPRLREGQHVVSDRSVWSSVMYQGISRGLGAEKIIELNMWACNKVFPDLVIYLQSKAKNADRISQPDRIEAEGEGFFNEVRRGFEDHAQKLGWVVIKEGSIEEVAAEIEAAVLDKIREKNQ
jgi:dTMP kinase